MAASADLGITKTLDSPASPLAGDTLVYVIVTTNGGPSTASDVTVIDSLPSGATFVSTTNSGSQFNSVVTWPTFSLASGGSRTDTIFAVAPVDGTYDNAARVSASASDPDASNNRSTTSSPVGAAADLSVIKSLASPASPIVGDTLVFVIVASNAGPSSPSDVMLVDSLPAGVTFVSATNSGTESGGVVSWTTYSLSSGANRFDTVRAVATAPGSQTNVARVRSSATDANGSNDRATAVYTVGANADLSVSKTLAGPALPEAGDTLIYVLVSANAGPSTAGDVALIDSIPAGLTFVGASNGGTDLGSRLSAVWNDVHRCVERRYGSSRSRELGDVCTLK